MLWGYGNVLIILCNLSVEDGKIQATGEPEVAGDRQTTTKEEETPIAKAEKEEGEGEGGKMEEEGEESSEEDDGSISDDPDRLWCVCKKPHNDRLVPLSLSWFHGDCVGISVAEGRKMERAGKGVHLPHVYREGQG